MIAIVTDVHYRMALAVIRDLGESGVRVICCERSGQTAPLGFFSKYCDKARVLPDDGYADALYSLCRELCDTEGEKPALLPVGAATLQMLTEPLNAARFADVAGLLLPEKEALDTLNDKEAVASLATTLSIPVPTEYENGAAAFPCVVKPRCGEKFGITASERYKIVRSDDALAAATEHFRGITGEDPLVQQYLPGDGLGCSVIAENGEVRRSICHRRIREYPVTGGPSSCCVAFRSEKLERYAAALACATNYSGLFMAEFKLDERGEPRLLEVNPRVWGTYPLTRVSKAGFSREWFRLAWNNGNPDKAIQEEKSASDSESEQGGEGPAFIDGKRMAFTASDLMAAVGYFKSGQAKRALGAFGSLLNPATKDGVWEFGDMKPAVKYYASLFKRRGE